MKHAGAAALERIETTSKATELKDRSAVALVSRTATGLDSLVRRSVARAHRMTRPAAMFISPLTKRKPPGFG